MTNTRLHPWLFLMKALIVLALFESVFLGSDVAWMRQMKVRTIASKKAERYAQEQMLMSNATLLEHDNGDHDDILNVSNSSSSRNGDQSSVFAKNENKFKPRNRQSNKRKTDIIDPKLAIVLHMGKAAGGTYGVRLRDWSIKIRACHPKPCLYRMRKDQAIIILLRDPVDRFVSAFYWRLQVLCDPEGDSRTDSVRATRLPDIYCKSENYTSKEELEVLFHRYNRSANELAETLCDADQSIAKQAALDMRQIGHLKDSIVDWMGPDWKQYAEFIYPVVVENSFDFIAQVDDSVSWFRNVSEFETLQSFEERHKKLDLLEDQRQLKKRQTQKQEQAMHTSVGNKKLLSELGEKCVAQFYHDDYELLTQLLDGPSACSETCRLALASILDRRAKRLGS